MGGDAAGSVAVVPTVIRGIGVGVEEAKLGGGGGGDAAVMEGGRGGGGAGGGTRREEGSSEASSRALSEERI